MDYLAVRFTPYSDASYYEIDWYEPVTGYHAVTNTRPGVGQMAGWSLADGWTPSVTDMGIVLWGRDGLWGRTFQVKFRYRNTSNVWSAWSETRGVTALPYWPDKCIMSGNGPNGVRTAVTVYAASTGFTNPGLFSYIRVFYSRSPNVNTGSNYHEGYFDINYPNTSGTFNGLINGETYYFTAVTYLNVNGTLLESYFRSDTASFVVGSMSHWDWTKSNGDATDAQTKKAYTAITTKGPTTDFHYLVWNDFVEKINEVAGSKGGVWDTLNGSYLDMNSTKAAPSSNGITAARFNAAKYNIGSRVSTGIADVSPGDKIMGRYFVTLANKLNEWIDSK